MKKINNFWIWEGNFIKFLTSNQEKMSNILKWYIQPFFTPIFALLNYNSLAIKIDKKDIDRINSFGIKFINNISGTLNKLFLVLTFIYFFFTLILSVIKVWINVNK